MRPFIGGFVGILFAVGVLGSEVTVTYLGHSCFTLQEDGGSVVMIDPYASYLPYPGLPAAADVVLITHGHIDHCAPCFGEGDRILGNPTFIWPFDEEGHVKEGRWRLTPWLTVDFVEATHVTESGHGRGKVCLFSFELGGIRFAHLADLGRPLTPQQIAALGPVQVLMIPVGGYFTIDAAEAIQVINQLPTVRVVFPMHYYVAGYCPWKMLAPLSTFLSRARAQGWTVREFDSPSVSLAPGSLPGAVEVWVLPFAGK